MKYPIHFILILLVGFLAFQSCGSYKTFTGTVRQDVSNRNDIIKSNELNDYLKNRDQIKFVLRTPAGFEQFSEEETIEWNIVFGQIEKELILKGHIVKDRVLLDMLLEKGDMSLTQVGKAMNTDIIIELINIEFDIPNPVKNFYIKEKNIKTSFTEWQNIDFVDCRIAMMECRITLVEVGNVGGIFKFYVSGCDTGSNFYVMMYESYDGSLDPAKEAYVGWNYENVSYKSLTHTYNLNEQSQKRAIEKLVASLLAELSTEKEVTN